MERGISTSSRTRSSTEKAEGTPERPILGSMGDGSRTGGSYNRLALKSQANRLKIEFGLEDVDRSAPSDHLDDGFLRVRDV